MRAGEDSRLSEEAGRRDAEVRRAEAEESDGEAERLRRLHEDADGAARRLGGSAAQLYHAERWPPLSTPTANSLRRVRARCGCPLPTRAHAPSSGCCSTSRSCRPPACREAPPAPPAPPAPMTVSHTLLADNRSADAAGQATRPSRTRPPRDTRGGREGSARRRRPRSHDAPHPVRARVCVPLTVGRARRRPAGPSSRGPSRGPDAHRARSARADLSIGSLNRAVAGTPVLVPYRQGCMIDTCPRPSRSTPIAS